MNTYNLYNLVSEEQLCGYKSLSLLVLLLRANLKLLNKSNSSFSSTDGLLGEDDRERGSII